MPKLHYTNFYFCWKTKGCFKHFYQNFLVQKSKPRYRGNRNMWRLDTSKKGSLEGLKIEVKTTNSYLCGFTFFFFRWWLLFSDFHWSQVMSYFFSTNYATSTARGSFSFCIKKWLSQRSFHISQFIGFSEQLCTSPGRDHRRLNF